MNKSLIASIIFIITVPGALAARGGIGAGIGIGLLTGAAIGAAAASSDRHYDDGYYDDGYNQPGDYGQDY